MSEDTGKPDSVVDEAKKRFARAKDFYGPQRLLAIADTQFAMGDSDNGWQWPETVRQSRVTDQRVCLTVNMTAQHCNQIINNIRQNRPQVNVIPADSGADKKTAEIFEGTIRNIQVASTADDAHDLAAEHSVYGGEGYWYIATEYESEKSFDLQIKIKQCPNPQLVFIDPDCREMDKSDARWGFVFEMVGKEVAKADYGDKGCDPSNWDGVDIGGWWDKETCRIANYYYCTDEKDTAYLLADGQTVLGSELKAQGVELKEGQYESKRATTVRKWKVCKLVGGHDKPVEEADWAGKYLPIVACVGKELNVNGEVIRKGIVRDLKDPARMVNYSYSESIQTVALQNKIPYIAAAEAIEGYEDNWKVANTSNAAYLPYNAIDDAGNPIPKPERQQPAVMPTAQVQLLQVSTEQMRAASGQQNANFGIKSEAASGVGIQRLKVQGETATFHFPDNLRRALQYEAKVLIDLIPKIYDTKRVVRILGLDGKESKALLDPDAPGYQDVSEQVGGDITPDDIQHIFNPTVGQYDVVIDTGPSFQTQRQEGFAMMTDIASRNPNLFAAAGDIIMRNSDIPGSDQIADRLQKTLPPQLQDAKGNAAAQMQQQMAQMQQQGQMMQQVISKMQMHIDELEKEKQAKVIDNQARIEIERIKQRTAAAQGVASHGIDAYKAQTDRVEALAPAMTMLELQALVAQTVQETLAAQPIQPEMEEPTFAIPVNRMDGIQEQNTPFNQPPPPPPMGMNGEAPPEEQGFAG